MTHISATCHRFLILSLVLFFVGPARGAEGAQAPAPTAGGAPGGERPALPDPADVATAMKRAATYFRRELAFAGGYAWKWTVGRGKTRTEGRESPSVISMQPPGTAAVGTTMLDAFVATRDRLYLQAAREAAAALMWCQLSSGGWDADFDFNPRFARKFHFRRDLDAGETEPGGRQFASSLDDNKTQSPLSFLLELAHRPECKGDVVLRGALDFGMNGLLGAQAANGGWGQYYAGPSESGGAPQKARMPDDWPRIWPHTDYTRYYTLNDNNLESVVALLLRAHELEKDARYLSAATRAGDFLLLARFDEPQPVWAQQYNHSMEPAWARKFEPPAVCTVESLGALRILIRLWIDTGDKRYIEPHAAAFAWFERSRLADGQWARFYELKTNKPLYCKSGTYELTYDDSDLPDHYGFKISDVDKQIEVMERQIALGRDELLRRKTASQDERYWARRAKGLASQARSAMATQKDGGYWLKDDWIDAGEFIRNMQAMISYVEAATTGGKAFDAIRAKENGAQRPQPK